jgi:hypothetical protein
VFLNKTKKYREVGGRFPRPLGTKFHFFTGLYSTVLARSWIPRSANPTGQLGSVYFASARNFGESLVFFLFGDKGNIEREYFYGEVNEEILFLCLDGDENIFPRIIIEWREKSAYNKKTHSSS